MKKIILLLTVAFLFSTGYAQQIEVGAMAGFNVSFARAKETDKTFHGVPLPRYALGGYAEITLPNKQFSIRPAFMFSREAYLADLFDGRATFRISYINLPIVVLYHSDLMQKRLSFGLGPYLAYALAGSYTYQGEKTKINWGSDPNRDDGKPLDIGLDLLASYKVNDLLNITAKFDLGIKNIAVEQDLIVRTRNFGVTVGYFLWKNK